MSSHGGSSHARNTLFETPTIRADPEEVRKALSKALSDCGCTIGQDPDWGEVERVAREDEEKKGTAFIEKAIELARKSSIMSAGDLEGLRERHEADVKKKKRLAKKATFSVGGDEEVPESSAPNDDDGETTESSDSETTTDDSDDQRQASNSEDVEETQANEALGLAPPTGALPQAMPSTLSASNLQRMAGNEPNLNAPKEEPGLRERRRSSGLSQYDELQYKMFGGDQKGSAQFSMGYMISKWKKEGHGGKKLSFENGAKGGQINESDSMSIASRESDVVVPGEVDRKVGMRLNRVDGQKVIRHTMNVEGLYSRFDKTMAHNQETMLSLIEKSEGRLEGRRESMKSMMEASAIQRNIRIQKDAIEWARRKDAFSKAKVESEKKSSKKSSLREVGMLIQSDIKNYRNRIEERVEDDDDYDDGDDANNDDGDDRSSNSSI
jgi:hypothetical protein